ncbi:hypothetical protein GIB67_000598 [Kingdonia uniflora]|uniref:UBA domain-containing protein n=1 Tax=Kingdonia uniflora TaxID=39325 RepID=A0A7J7P757_9MAGN|nr:hypothetical protein GIB67_000598 [Kingdonia uniflora]
MNGGPSGFHNAPVTRTFVIACAILTILLGIQGRSAKVGLSYQDVFGRLHLWRLITSVFTFSSTPELMFGLYLLYYFRVFERQIGSNKYSVFILLSVVGSSLFQLLVLAMFKDSYLNVLAPGPYGLIFSSFIPFYLDIPVSTRFRIFGIHFSDKSFIYLAGLQNVELNNQMPELFVNLTRVSFLQLLMSSWKRSFVPGLCGILAGSLYRFNVFGIRRLKFPDFIASAFSQLSWPSAGGSSSTAATGHALGNAPSYRGREVEENYPLTAPISSTIEPPEDSIATLLSMGFDRNSARQALVQARNDVNVATNILLEAQSH